MARDGSGIDLLVSSAGGHLTQLRLLAPRIRPVVGRTRWVSYDHPHVRSELRGEDYVPGHGPSTRNMPNAVRNLQLARRLLDPRNVSRVISTGAGIAVPFLHVAAARGIEAHYVESATRVQGPSLAGRMLDVGWHEIYLYTQSPTWASSTWGYAGSVFDGFMPLTRAGRRGGLRILVSLGTHESYGFDALAQRVSRVVSPDDEVVWQLGATPPPSTFGLRGIVHRYLPVEEMAARLAWADVVVAHAGTGIALSSMLAGHHPVLVPRRPARGEHVDGHQGVTAADLARRGLAAHVEVEDLQRDHLVAAAAMGVELSEAATFRLATKLERRELPRPVAPIHATHSGRAGRFARS